MLINRPCFLILIGCLSRAALSLKDECPHPEESYPCYCEEDETETVMHCNYLQENKQIVQAIQNLTDYKLSTLSIWMFNNDTIKSNAFKGPQLGSITFSHSHFKMESPQFVGQETSLGRLTFLACFDEEHLVDSWSLGHLQNLKAITFDKNSIKSLKNNWLTTSGQSLRSITFDECKIEELEGEVFSKIETLTTLFLPNNKIKVISRSMFPKENLRSISLSGNLIESLPDNIFDNLPSLTTVELERNRLSTLSETVWGKKIKDLKRVYLEDNPVRCDQSLKWIAKTILPRAFTGTCSTPKKLAGKEIRTLTPADFH